MPIRELVTRLKSFPHAVAPDDAISQLRRLEDSHQVRLPDDFRTLYTSLAEVSIFDASYRIMPLNEVADVGSLQGGEYGRLCCSPFWLAFCDVLDSNYVAIDLPSGQILDCDHEDMGRARVIAANVTDFIDRLLENGPEPYWLASDFERGRVLEFEPGPEFHRLEDSNFWSQLGAEDGPEKCRSPGCDRLHISFSTLCRRHHYENVRGRACPFE